MQHSDFIPASRPVLANPADTGKWLDGKRFADCSQTCAAFAGLLSELEEAPPQASALVAILETLRSPMRAALEEQTRRFAGRALPLSAVEQTAFVLCRDLWLAQMRVWHRLLRASWKTPALVPDRARLALRMLESLAGLLIAHLAARREISAEHWHRTHQTYALAEREGLAQVEVGTANNDRTSTCAAVYARVLLLQLANPAALAQREFAWAQRWARRWAPKVQLARATQGQGGLAVDLDSGSGALWAAAGDHAASLRFVDCALVAQSLRARLKKLAAGETPESLGLGKDCAPRAAQDLLNNLLHCWSDSPQQRQFPRRSSSGRAELVASFAGMHRALGGVFPEAGKTPWDYSRRRNESLQVFQRTTPLPLSPAATEGWESLDESANGFRLRRSGCGSRLAHRQLVAVRPGGADQFILCEIRWLVQGEDGSLHIGAKALPGLPQACTVCPPIGNDLPHNGWTQAFALPLSKGLAPNLVLPFGWYKEGRELDLKLGDEQFRVRLDELVERGHDYQRVRFAAIAPG